MKEKWKTFLTKMMVVVTSAVVLPLGLVGCSLAVEGAGAEESGDRLIGVFVTDTFVDTFDMDAYLGENAGKLASGSEIEINETDAASYSDAIYATIDKKGSEDPSDWDITFPGLTGVRFFCPVFEVDGETYHLNICDSGITAVSMDVNATDSGEDMSLEAVLYFVPENKDSAESGETALAGGTENETQQMESNILEEDSDGREFYPNAVWQKADGTIYLTPESGYMISGDDVAEGEKMSAILTAESTTTKDGETVVESDQVTVRFSVMYRPEKITVWQMSADHAVLASESYAPEAVPEKITPETDTAYLLVETQKMNPDGNAVVSREWYERPADGEESETITTYYAQNGMAAAREAEVVW